jgi:ABC-2 type transport system permease protein
VSTPAKETIEVKLLTHTANHSSEPIFSFISLWEGSLIIFCYLFYLISGFLLYSSLLAAIGASVDAENESWPLQFPVWVILVFALLVVTSFHNPHNPVAAWASIIPFTAPVVMLMHVPFDVPLSQLIISMVLLIVTFVFTTYLAGKVLKLGFCCMVQKLISGH